MNILVVCNKFPYPPKDGGQIATFAMIRGMKEAGHSVTVVAINTKKHYYDVTQMPANIAALADFRTLFLDTDLTIKDALCNLLFSRLPYTATRFISKDFETLLRGVFNEKQFDVVQLEGLYLCAYIPLIRECSSAKIAYRAHNVEYEIWARLAHETKNFVKRIYLQNLAKRVEHFEKSMLNTYDYIVPITQRDADTYTQIGNAKPSFLAPTGIFVNDLPQKETVVEQPISLFHLGALDWSPNQQGLAWFIQNCLPLLRSQFPDLQLFVAGRNAPSWIVEQLQVPGVVYEGEVPDAYEFMSKHTIMIVPLLAGGGMRIKILEGMSYGKVIVSTSIGAEGISGENDKDFCIADTPQDFTNAIVRLVKNKELCANLGENATIFVSTKFDNRQILANLLSLYSNS